MDIPLFPLPNLVLFPSVVVPLHIFEERYKTMVNHCIDSGGLFGIVLLASGATEESEDTIHRVGVAVRVIEVERLAEGRLNVLCAGDSRFRISRFISREPCWSAAVDFFEDDREPAPLLESAARDVLRLYRRASELSARLKASELEPQTFPESPVNLSYMISYALDFDPERKQRLLATTSTVNRLTSLIFELEQMTVHLERRLQMQQLEGKAKKNGDFGKPH